MYQIVKVICGILMLAHISYSKTRRSLLSLRCRWFFWHFLQFFPFLSFKWYLFLKVTHHSSVINNHQLAVLARKGAVRSRPDPCCGVGRWRGPSAVRIRMTIQQWNHMREGVQKTWILDKYLWSGLLCGACHILVVAWILHRATSSRNLLEPYSLQLGKCSPQLKSRVLPVCFPAEILELQERESFTLKEKEYQSVMV